MLRMGVPLEGVKHMMVKDGVDPAILDCDHSQPLPAKFSPFTDGPPLKDDPVYGKFFKVGTGVLVAFLRAALSVWSLTTPALPAFSPAAAL
jgi:hypothetical protein